MNTKTTLTLLVLVLALGAWVFLGEPNTTTTKDAKGNQSKLIPGFKADDCVHVEIARIKTSTETIVLVREKEEKKEAGSSLTGSSSWRLESPVKDKADDGAVRSVLSKLEWLESLDTLEGERAEKATKESFGAVEARLTVKREKKKPDEEPGKAEKIAKGIVGEETLPDVTIELGSKIPGDSRYARVIGRPQVYLIGKDLFETLTKDLFELRSKDLVQSSKDDATKVTLKVAPATEGPGQQPRVLELAKKDRFWRIGGEGGDYAERKKVEDVVDKAKQLKPLGIEKDDPTPDDLKKLGLEPQPAFELVIEDGKGRKERLTLGLQAGAIRYARLDGRSAVYKVDSNELERELKRDPVAFRSDTLIQMPGSEVEVTAFGARWKGGPEVKLKKDGTDWKLEQPSVRLEEQPTKDLLKRLLDLKVATREPDQATLELAKVGLADAGLVLTVEEEGTKRELLVGDPVKDKAGCFYVKRAEDARVLTAALGDLPAKLRAAPLDLRSKTVFKAGQWDAKKVVLQDAAGATTFEAEKVNYKWTVKGQDDADEEKVKKLLALFDDLKAREMIADVTSASVAAAGLEKPQKLAVTLDVWKKDKKEEEVRTLLLGKREGDAVTAMEQGGPTVAKVDAEFLDLIARGFKKGRTLYEVSKWDAKKIVVKEGEKELVLLEKKDSDWFRGDKKLDTKEAEKLLEPFEKVEASGFEDASDAKKKERGLAPAWRTVSISVKRPGSAEEAEVKTLLVGGAAGEKRRWVMTDGQGDMGVAFDDVATKVDGWLHDHPAEAAKPEPGPPRPPEAPKPEAPKAPEAPKPADAPKPPSALGPVEPPKIPSPDGSKSEPAKEPKKP